MNPPEGPETQASLPDPDPLPTDRPIRVAVLISGRGSNMTALIEAAAAQDCPFEIVGVLSNRADAPGLAKAIGAGLPTAVVDHKGFGNREDFERAVEQSVQQWTPDLICLAGFMRKLTPWLVTRWWGRMLNVHPSLLPSFRGLDTHARAIEAGVQLAGCTVHIVSPDLDAGPILAQGIVPVLPNDTPDSLAARVLEIEHPLYVGAVWALATGSLQIQSGRIVGPGPRLLPHPRLVGVDGG